RHKGDREPASKRTCHKAQRLQRQVFLTVEALGHKALVRAEFYRQSILRQSAPLESAAHRIVGTVQIGREFFPKVTLGKWLAICHRVSPHYSRTRAGCL